MARPHSTTYFDLLDAFGQEGCPICRLALRGVERYLESINYEGVNDPGFRAQTRTAHGFCNVHAAQWSHMAHVLGTALIYDDVLTDTNATLGRLRFHGNSVLANLSSLWRGRGEEDSDHRLAPHGECPACVMLAEQERTLTSGLLDGLHDPSFRDSYTKSDGLCLPHLRRGLNAAPDEAVFNTLRDAAIAVQERLHAQLHEIIRKHDYRYRDEPTGEERGATARTVEHVDAAKGIIR